MHLTDSEIREILIQEKRKKRRRQMMRRRITAAVALLLILILIIVIAMHGRHKDDKAEKDSETSIRGTIFLDPGHGGSDPGSEYDGRYEKDDTLAFALAVRDQLTSKGFRVAMSRDDDDTVERPDRGKMAVDAGAGLMMSIHRNKAQGEGNGVEVYIPKSDTKESRLLGENVMKALVASGFEERSITAGIYLDPGSDYEELAAAGSIPSCLAEVGFINDDGDNDIFDNHLDTVAGAVADALSDTYAALYESEGDGDADTDDDSDDESEGNE